ncbi:MAG: GNAT family N-acetyltransferase [Chloroflexi bacterium]|nr:GNAT family N-acetyltransferase [Chloroflexota bacterium]
MADSLSTQGPAPSASILPYDDALHAGQPWRVVKAVFDEYGFPFDENDYDADLREPAVHYDGATGWFAVAVDPAGRVVGTVGVSDEGGGLFELHRLYVLAEARRGGTGRALVAWAIAQARERGAERMVLFSDIAFDKAHRLYERMGFRCNRFRYAPDPWQSREWGFVREL